jgi:hypothetical protein
MARNQTVLMVAALVVSVVVSLVAFQPWFVRPCPRNHIDGQGF